MTSDVPTTERTHRRRLWTVAVVVVVLAYATLTVAIVVGSPLDRLDRFLYQMRLVPPPSGARLPVELYVLVGQGVPASTIAAFYAIRRSLATRTWTPWVMFVLALLLLNTTVGAMKHATGRLGPRVTNVVHTIWAGGTIYPSGHAANAIVMYGLIAMIAPVAHRRIAATIATVLGMTIGLGTVALNTHWISDVFGGWLAGALVLLILVPLTPPVDRFVTRTAVRMLPTLVRWRNSTPLRPLGTPRPTAVRAAQAAATDHQEAPLSEYGAVARANADGSPARQSDTDRPPARHSDADRPPIPRLDTVGAAGSGPPHRADARSTGAPPGRTERVGTRSQHRNRRHHSLPQDS